MRMQRITVRSALLFLLVATAVAMLVDVAAQTPAPTFSAGNVTKLFYDARYFTGPSGRSYDVSPDGQRFLMIKNTSTDQAPTMVVVLNWLEELKAKLPAK